MARRGKVALPDGPGWTDLFKADASGGDDGAPMVGCLLSNSHATVGLDYRVGVDPAGEFATLKPGEAIPLSGNIQLIQGRGVGGASEGQVEENRF